VKGRLTLATLETQTRLASPLKWHGGKHYLAKRIIELMPPHLHYVEPFFGGGAVLLAKDPSGISEVANDLYGDLTNFWRVLQDSEAFRRLIRRLQATPFSAQEWRTSGKRLTGAPQSPLDVDAAVAFFVRARQSRQGLMRHFATLSRTRTRRGLNEQASSWLTAVEGLPEIHARLSRVVILNDDATAVIRQQDGPNTLFYCDPPYLPSTRALPDAYAKEMTRAQHQELLEVLRECRGKVMISGYPNGLYDEVLPDWNRHDFAIDNKASGAKTKRLVTESIWCNL
jgi:DNA adenine methylase